MSNKVDFSKFLPLLESNEEFSITEKQYLKNTGREMPKGKHYLKHSSAFSREAKNTGTQLR